MTVYLVRHAAAGDRTEWDGRDDLRPLTNRGRRQADWLAEQLASEPVKRIVSSPSVRCVETVQPLAARLGLVVETSPALAEGAAVAGVLGLLCEAAADHAVLCSHGDVIPEALDALARLDGLPLPPGYPFAKGSVWVLHGEARPFVRAHYLAPPRR
jgi:8-oxo-dGTP diphosphatase